MTKLSAIACVIGAVAFHPAPLLAQTVELSPDVAARLAKSPPPPPSNEVVGIDIDRFVGNPFQSPVRISHGVILVRSILRHGDPYHPGDPGAVLEYRNDLMYGTLLGHNQTPLVHIPEQLFLYIEDGKGRLDNGAEYWDLKEGMGVLIPPEVKHRIINSTPDAPLHMLMLTWTPPAGVTPAAKILVRDISEMPFTTCGGVICHWSYFGKNLFNPSHGLDPKESMHVVYVPPMSIGEPHAHVTGWEEIWVKLPPYGAYMMLGSELREMPPNTAFLAPPNGKTVHSVMNLRTDATQAWLFIGKFIFNQPDYGREPLIASKPLPQEQ